MYTCWRDSRTVLALSTAHPGHESEVKVTRKVIEPTGTKKLNEIPRPVIIEKYNKFMGGVDKSDQFIAYHNVLRKTVRYWKTLFYHLVDIATVNSFIIYNILAYDKGHKLITENDFRDALVIQIIQEYGRGKRDVAKVGRPCRSECRVRHGSQVFGTAHKSRCQYCLLNGTTMWTQRKCVDCNFQPALCQVVGRDCHAKWHLPSFDEDRDLWFKRKNQSTSD